MPTTDRIGNRRAFDILCSLSLLADRDLNDGFKFLWWLWIANFGPRLSEVVGDGIASAELQEVQADCDMRIDSVLTSFTRNDSVCFARLLRVSGGGPGGPGGPKGKKSPMCVRC